MEEQSSVCRQRLSGGADSVTLALSVYNQAVICIKRGILAFWNPCVYFQSRSRSHAVGCSCILSPCSPLISPELALLPRPSRVELPVTDAASRGACANNTCIAPWCNVQFGMSYFGQIRDKGRAFVLRSYVPGAFLAADHAGFPSADVPGGFDRSCLISQQVGKNPVPGGVIRITW